MDKSHGSKKRSPAGASRRAYSLFSGIINLTQSHSTKPNSTGSNVGAASPQDPQGSSNIYTVTVNNNPASESNTNPAKTYENIAAMKKRKGDQSPSTVSSLTNPGGMSSGSGSCTSSGPIGPAPRTLSILTALNELAISDEIRPNPNSNVAPPIPSSSSRNNGTGTSKSNPSHSSCHYPSKRSSHVPSATFGGSEQLIQQELLKNAASSSSAPLHHSPSTIYHSTSKGAYSNSDNARLKGYNESHVNPVCTSINTLPSTLRTAHKSLENHKESLTRKAGVKQRDGSKSRTPDWIWKIFQLTKHGKLEELQQSLLGLDSTLIRHLADAKGNTVLHCAVRGGHVNTLQWLVSVLGSQCTEAALSDNNQAGRTVILTALKKGQLQCLQWLVHHTKCGGKALVPNEGERSLLHFAATYGDINVVRWLCSELIEKGIPVDIRDAGGVTPLHDAAKSGHIIVCHELVLAGADPLSQTELGWRPSDLAIRHRHIECASYFGVAEAAGSLGNQLHSLLLAFNHLRQEHEELRSHFRETLRVGKSLAKERNDLIKHFPSKWAQDSASSLLLGGTSNGTRLSDLEHKLGLAEQAWKKFSQNVDDAGDSMLNGEEALVSNFTSQDFLQRLAGVQLRHERNQNLANSLSTSSDEDQDEENSSSDASSSDADVERITSITAGSRMGINAGAITHSSNVSSQMENNTMTIRFKAAPWLLQTNDVFLSQLSPFVGAHGKSLPTLDLLHGAPSSPSLLSPIVTPSSVLTTSNIPTTTTDSDGKNETSLAQMDAERHGSGQRNSTSIDVSVLEVIEPNSPTTPSSKKKREDGVEQFHMSSRPWLGFNDQTKGMLRSVPKTATTSSNHGIGGDERNRGGATGRKLGLVVNMSGASEVANDAGCTESVSSCSGKLVSQQHGEHDGQVLPNTSRLAQQPCDQYDMEGRSYSNATSSNNHRRASESVHHAPDLIRGTHYRARVDNRPTMQSSSRGHQPTKDYSSHSTSANGIYERICRVNRNFAQSTFANSYDADDISRLDVSFQGGVVVDESNYESETKGRPSPHYHMKDVSEQLPGHSSLSSTPFTTGNQRSSGDRKSGCASGESTSESVAYGSQNSSQSSPCKSKSRAYSGKPSAIDCVAGSGESSGGVSKRSKARSPSPKSYVTKLTVIPAEVMTETCFLSLRSTSFREDDSPEVEQDSQTLHLAGENQDEMSCAIGCQIPSDSVSSSNTPVMPRFNSSGTVVFPLRKPGWYSSELLSPTTPDSSLAGRLSPTPSDASRTESALAPPPSYVSHASQNSEISKTESARGHTSESGADRDLERPGVGRNYVNDSNHCECIHSSIVATEQRSQSIENVAETAEDAQSYEMCAGSSKNNPNHSPNKKDDDSDNDRTAIKESGMFANQRIQASTCLVRSHVSTGIHKASAHRLPKGIRGHHSKPWYEIEGSDDEGSLLQVAKSRSSHSSRFSTSSTSSDSNPEDGSSENESDRNNSDEDDEGSEPMPRKEPNSQHNCSNYF